MGYVPLRRDHIVEDYLRRRRKRRIMTMILVVPAFLTFVMITAMVIAYMNR